jgi:P-type Ca2+ transporter type 2C
VPVNTEEILEAAEQMAASGLRVLAFAERRLPAQPVDLSPDSVEQDLTIIGLVGMGDPIRNEAAEAVEICRQAGITTIMITGDHPVTARALAQELRILEEDQSVFTGRELAETSPEALLSYVDRVRVWRA